MTPRRVHEASLRPDRLELSRLFWAIAISIGLHLMFYGGYQLARTLQLQLPVWAQRVIDRVSALQTLQKQPERPPEREMSLIFVDVNPQLAVAEPPENTRFYSDKNSQAANPEMDRPTDVPKITGKQEDIIKAEDVNRARMERLQPAIPQTETEPQPEQLRLRTPQPVGDLAIAKPDTEPRKEEGTAEQARPRRLQEVRNQPNRNQLVGEKMKQEGGVNRLRIEAGFDAKASVLGGYDHAMIEAISQRWFDLLDTIRYSYDRNGKVVISFRLNHDGTVSDIQILENTVEEKLHGMLGFLCQKAVSEPAPYPRWPRDMRLTLGRDYRDLTFTFYYR
jgi:hypothetical protein